MAALQYVNVAPRVSAALQMTADVLPVDSMCVCHVKTMVRVYIRVYKVNI